MFEYSKHSKNAAIDPEDFTARELYEQCRAIGSLALKSRRQFIGLLPLVERRQAYRGRGLYSTYDFAAMLGGISRDIVTEVLRLDTQLREFPLVRKLLYRGEVGWTKIRLIAGLLTKENQEEWIEKVRNISHVALQVYLKDFDTQQRSENIPTLLENNSLLDSHAFRQLTGGYSSAESYKNGKNDENKAENFHVEISEYNRGVPDSQDPTSAPNSSVPYMPTKFDSLAYERETFSFSLNRQIAARMRLFRQKLEKERKELITWEEVMVEFLKKMENVDTKPIAKEPTTRQPTMQQPTVSTDQEGDDSATASRHIPIAVRREVLSRYKGLCAFRDCNKPAEILHHTRRFSLTNGLSAAQAHDPDFIKPLCKPHERVIHSSLIANEEIDPIHWKLLANPDTNAKKYAVDQMVIGYRKPK